MFGIAAGQSHDNADTSDGDSFDLENVQAETKIDTLISEQLFSEWNFSL